MKSFIKFITESVNEVVITFGRFNPPTIGHEKLIKAVAKIARNSDFFIYASQSQDPKSNPFGAAEKVKWMKQLFPKFASNIVSDVKLKNVLAVASKCYDDGYTKFTLVVGSDRIETFKTILKKYDGVKGPHGYYKFPDGISIKSAGERDPDSDDAVSAMSASKMRAAARANDYATFAKGLPQTFKAGQKLFAALRTAMNLK